MENVEIRLNLKELNSIPAIIKTCLAKFVRAGKAREECFKKGLGVIKGDDAGIKFIVTDRYLSYSITLPNPNNYHFIYGLDLKDLYNGLRAIKMSPKEAECVISFDGERAIFRIGDGGFGVRYVDNVPSNIDFVTSYSAQKVGSFVINKRDWMDAIKEWKLKNPKTEGLFKFVVPNNLQNEVSIELFAWQKVVGYRKWCYESGREAEDPKPDVKRTVIIKENLIDRQFVLGYFDTDYIEVAIGSISGVYTRVGIYYLATYATLSFSSYDDKEMAVTAPLVFV